MINRSNQLRINNRETILREIICRENVSRHEIIEKTGLAPSTVSVIINEILEEGLIRSKGKLTSSGTGRKSDVLSKNGSYERILAINLTLENCRAALVDLEFNIIRDDPLYLNSHDSPSVIGTILPVIKGYVSDESNRIQSIVLSLPHFPYNREELKEEIQKECALPVYVINNVEAMGLYDSRFLYSPFNSLFYIFVGQGIGSAFFHRGELLMGENGFASDLGHIHITDKPLTCRCGRTGCLETVASERSLGHGLKALTGSERRLAGDELMGEMRKQIDMRNDDVQDLVAQTAAYLAEAILTARALLDPQGIILTGRITSLNPFLSGKLEEYLCEKSGLRSLYSNKLIYQEYNPDSVVKGAALFAFLSVYGGFNKSL